MLKLVEYKKGKYHSNLKKTKKTKKKKKTKNIKHKTKKKGEPKPVR